MAQVHLHLQNVPPEAGAADIQRFFGRLKIPEGGVQIVGGSKGQAFVTFASNEDLLQATNYDKNHLMGRQLAMNLVSGEDIERIIDSMKHELVPKIRPTGTVPTGTQQPSQSREPSTSLRMAYPPAYPPAYHPPVNPASKNVPPWRRPQMDSAQPGNGSSLYDGGAPKRMRFSSKQQHEGMYYNSINKLGSHGNRWQSTQEPTRLDSTKPRQSQPSSWGNQCALGNHPGPTPHQVQQSHSRQNEGVNQGGQRFPGPTHENPERVLSKRQRKRLNRASGFSGPSPNSGKQVSQGLNPGQPDKVLTKTQRKKLNKARNKAIRWAEGTSNEPTPAPTTKVPEKEVTAKAAASSEPVSTCPPSKIPTQKPARSKAPQKTKISGGKKPTYLVKRVCCPYSGTIKQALYFTLVKNLPEDATASSVWQQFGGATGHSVGVLLFDKDGNGTAKEAFVAYENYYDRNTEIPRHEGARDWIDRAVYIKLAGASPETKLYKSTPKGEDLELSDSEKSMLGQKFLLDTTMKQATWLTEKERESEQPILNEISRTLFDIKSTEAEEQSKVPDLGEKQPSPRKMEPCYLRLDCLPPDITAQDVWDWFGTTSGPATHVTLTRVYGSKLKDAYVAFRDQNSRTAEMYKYKQCKAMAEQEAFHEMADSSIKVVDSTDENMKRPEGISCPFSGSIRQALYFIYLRTIPDNSTPSSVWQKFGGPTGQSVGVLLLQKNGFAEEAYVAFENYYDRNSEIPRNRGSIDWTDRAVYTKLANASPGSKVYKTTSTEEDTELSDEDKAMFGQPFLLNSSRQQSIHMTEKQREAEQPILNEISRSLFDIKSTEENKQKSIPDSAENQPGSCTSGGPVYLRLDCLPPDITAREVWDWFGAATGPSFHVTLARLYGKETLKTKIGYVAFRDRGHCDAELNKYDQSKIMTEEEVFNEVGSAGIRVTDSSEELEANEKQVDVNAEAATHILKVNGIGKKISSSKLWTGWFGGKKGPTQALTLMDDGKTQTAFALFHDPVKCDAQVVKFQSCEVIPQNEMLKLFSRCPTFGPHDKSIMTSSAIGDRIMSKKERADLVRGFHLTEKPPQKSKPMDTQDASHETTKPDEGVKRPKGMSCPFSGNIKQALFFTSLGIVPTDTNPSYIWEQFGGKTGPSVGVLVLDQEGFPKEAYVAYENYYNRNSEIPRYEGATDWTDRAVYTKLANASPDAKIHKTLPNGLEIELPDKEKAQLGQKFLLDSSGTHSSQLTAKERESQQLILNDISRSLFDLESTEEDLKLDIPDLGESQPGPCTSGSFYLRLHGLPPDITAHEVWDWFGAATGHSLRVILTKFYYREEKKNRIAYVAFRDENSCKAEAYKYDQSKIMTELEAFDEISDTCIKIIGSTEEVEAEEEKNVDAHIEASNHVMKIKDVGKKISSAKVWAGWFGGKKGPAHAVTLMDDGKTRAAFVVFHDPAKRDEHLAKHQFSEVISEVEMLKQFACCPTNGPPDKSIVTSNVFESYHMMTKRYRAELRARFHLTEKPSEVNDQSKVKSSNQTSVISNDKQNESESKSLDDIKKCNLTSKEDIARSSFKPEGKIDRGNKDAKQGSTSDEDMRGATAPGNAVSTASKPKENVDSEEKGAKQRADLGYPSCIGGSETNCILQIPNVTKRITSSKIWSWFNGSKGSARRVTVVPKLGNTLGTAFVEFRNAAACNAALTHYQKSKVVSEPEVLYILANHASRSSKDIFQSSVVGLDKALTVEERDLIIEKVLPGRISNRDSDAEEIEAPICDDEAGDTPGKTTDGGLDIFKTKTKRLKRVADLQDPGGSSRKIAKTTEGKSEKFFLQIPNIDENVTACKVWSWFGGERGPLPGVTVIQQAAGMNKNAYVGFSEHATRNAVQLQYKDSVELDEETMLQTLAEACKSDAVIFQSSVTGDDRLLTSVERELIKNQVFPDAIQRQPTEEDVSMYEKSDEEEETVDNELPSQSGKPKLLQKSDYEYLQLTELRSGITAFILSVQYKPCFGVTLVKNALGSPVTAYIAFEPDTNPKANVWQKTRDRELAEYGLDYEIYEDTGKLGDRLITPKERQEFLEYVKQMTLASS